MRIVRLANFVAPRSGGLRTAMRALGSGYLAAGHEPVLVVPGAEPADEASPACSGSPAGCSPGRRRRWPTC